MPGPLVPAIIAGVSTIAGQGINAGAQGKMNRKTREYNERMWHMQQNKNHDNWLEQNQREDMVWNRQNDMAIKMWQMENDYNSPRAMMQRFQEAGLNPNLIYGQSNMGGSISTATAESGKLGDSPNAGSWNPRAPQFDLNEGLLAYNAFRESGARVDNLEEMNKNLAVERDLKIAETANRIADTKGKEFDLDFKRDNIGISTDALREAVRKTKTETDLMLRRDEREAAQSASSLREAVERILNMRDQRMTNEVERKLKAAQEELTRQNIDYNDVNPVRIIPSIIGEPLRDFRDGARNIYNQWKWLDKSK